MPLDAFGNPIPGSVNPNGTINTPVLQQRVAGTLQPFPNQGMNNVMGAAVQTPRGTLGVVRPTNPSPNAAQLLRQQAAAAAATRPPRL